MARPFSKLFLGFVINSFVGSIDEYDSIYEDADYFRNVRQIYFVYIFDSQTSEEWSHDGKEMEKRRRVHACSHGNIRRICGKKRNLRKRIFIKS